MLAPRRLPDRYEEFNRLHRAPFGRALPRPVTRLPEPLKLRLAGPYGFEPYNNTTRAFEYPWVFEQVAKLGRPLVVADVGAGLAGLQYTLARAGHTVHAVDPGAAAPGQPWAFDASLHARLASTFRAPVRLHAATLDRADIAKGSLDVVLSVSAVEHLSPEELRDFAAAARALLKPTGRIVLTIDLFLDLHPFTTRQRHLLGTNVNVAQLLEQLGADLVVGKPAELHGFAEFDADRVQANLAQYLIGDRYPVLTQCVVAEPRLGVSTSG